jgi:hypothetical protein
LKVVTIDELFPRKSQPERRIGPVDVHFVVKN